MNNIKYFLFFLISFSAINGNLENVSSLEKLHRNMSDTICNSVVMVQSCIGLIQHDLAELPEISTRLINPTASSFINDIPHWVYYIHITSPDVFILFENSAYYASPSCMGTKLFPLEPGDHNLWFAHEDELWGFEKNKTMFKQAINSPRILAN